MTTILPKHQESLPLIIWLCLHASVARHLLIALSFHCQSDSRIHESRMRDGRADTSVLAVECEVGNDHISSLLSLPGLILRATAGLRKHQEVEEHRY